MTASPQPESGHARRPVFWLGAGLVCALLLVHAWLTSVRLARIEHVTASPYWSVDAPAQDAQSPTGLAGQTRCLIVPGHSYPSYRWIMQAQRMAATGEWRQHHIDHENFPSGRTVRNRLPYRCWLVLVGWFDSVVSSRPLPLAVEQGALYAGPLLHFLLIASVVLFVGRLHGAAAAGLAAVALVTLFPFAGAFQPGAPDHHALAWTCLLWSALLLHTGCLQERPRLGFALSGVAGGIGLWSDHLAAEPILAGLALGAAVSMGVARLAQRGGPVPPHLPWRLWGAAGGLACLLGWSVEYFPVAPGWAPDSIHPLHAVAWLGVGEALHRLERWAQHGRAAWNPGAIALTVLAVLALAALPLARSLAGDGRFLASDLFARELTTLPGSVSAPGMGTWLFRDGPSAPLVTTALPLLVAGLALWVMLTEKISPRSRRALMLALGPVLVGTALACHQLRWWNGCDAMLVVLMVAITAAAVETGSSTRRWLWPAACALPVLPGLLLLVPPAGSRGAAPLDELELQAVVERDLAHWLVQQHGSHPTVVFTTPALSETLAYYGNIKGIASLSPENTAGLDAATRIASASTWTEAAALLENRAVTHLILPSWDPALEQLAKIGRQLPAEAELPPNTLVSSLQHWTPPPWLRLLTYHAPKDLGPAELDATVFAVHPGQDEILALCRLADYLVEMELTGEIRAVREKLRLYPRSLPALAALAQASLALGDSAAHDSALQTLLPQLARRAARSLPVDRRIGLAALLLQARQRDAAREQMQQCAAEIDASRLRELTTGQIVRLLALNDLLGITLPDPALRPLALSLLPPSLRARLQKPGE